MKKLNMICQICGSENVVKDALAEWDKEKQNWVLRAVLDNTNCEDCESEDCVEGVTLQ